MLGPLLGAWFQLMPLTHGCPTEGSNVSNTLGEDRFFDAAVCPYADLMTLPIFAAFFFLGVVNVPIYIRQESVVTPFVITLITGGVVLSFVAGILQTIATAVILFTLGLGPVLLIRRAQQQ